MTRSMWTAGTVVPPHAEPAGSDLIVTLTWTLDDSPGRPQGIWWVETSQTGNTLVRGVARSFRTGRKTVGGRLLCPHTFGYNRSNSHLQWCFSFSRGLNRLTAGPSDSCESCLIKRVEDGHSWRPHNSNIYISLLCVSQCETCSRSGGTC